MAYWVSLRAKILEIFPSPSPEIVERTSILRWCTVPLFTIPSSPRLSRASSALWCALCSYLHTSRITANAVVYNHPQRIFDSRSRYNTTFSFSFCPKAFRSSPCTPPLRSRTSATRIYGPSSATSSLKASWLSLSSLSSSSLPAGYFTFTH